MSKSSKNLDLSFLKCHGYTFGVNVKKNSLTKVQHDNNHLACKIISQKKSKMNDEISSLENLKKISHPHIIPVHSIVQNGKFTFVFMQWIDGGNLLNHIKENGMVKESLANLWFYQLVSAIKYLHSMDLAHCNLSCESVLVSNQNLKLSGLSYMKRCSPQEKIIHKSRKSFPVYYSPPEINKGSPGDARKVDVYALGAILFIKLNAMVPFLNYSNMPQLIEDQLIGVITCEHQTLEDSRLTVK